MALLRDRTFGSFFAAKLLSSCGTWIQNLAAAVLMFELTRSAFMVGAVSALQFVPPLLLALWAGALTDQFDRRKLVMLGRTVSGFAVSTLAALLLIRGAAEFVGPTLLLVAVLIKGMGFAISNPAMQALLPGLVPARDLEQALALNAAGPSIARTVGPALGAGLLFVGGPAAAFAVAAGSHLVFAFVLLFIRGRVQAKPRERPSIFGGVLYLRQDRKAALLVLGVAMLGVGAEPVVTLTPSLAAQMGEGDEVVGLFASAFGVGAVVLTVTLRFLRRVVSLRGAGISGFWGLTVGLLVVAFSTNVSTGIVGFMIAGAGFMMGQVALTTRIQRRIPDELRGRVMALWGVAFFGSRPFAAIATGSLADLLSVQVAVLATAVLVAFSSLFARVRYSKG